MLHSDPQLRAVSHLVVDEVHERDLDTDFLLLLVRRLLRSGCRDEGDPLRVVLMSATVDAERLREYFYGEHTAPDAMPVVPIEGRTFSVRMRWWDEMWTEWEKRGEREASTDDEADDGDDTGASDGMEDGVEKVDPPAAASSASQTRWDVRHGASLALVEQAVRYADRELLREASQPLSPSPTPPHPAASILVFLPGVAEIEQLRARLARHARYHVVRLHASLSPEAQALAFRPCPRPATQQRKVVCATNIAESSVTVEDVVAVVDTCRVRQMHAVDIEMSGVQLRETWCSRASAVQRAGRAGRVRPGVCYRLVDRETVWEREMEAHTSPEMVRLPVDRLLLSLMMMMMTTTTTTTGAPSKTPSLQEAMDVLLQDALDPPPLAHVQQSARRLERMGAVRNAQQTASAGMLTPLGTHLATMPLDAAVGKLLLYGALFGCVHAVLTLAAVVTEGTPFRRSPDDAERVRRACEQRFGRAHSDLLTDAAAFEAWQEKAERARRVRRRAERWRRALTTPGERGGTARVSASVVGSVPQHRLVQVIPLAHLRVLRDHHQSVSAGGDPGAHVCGIAFRRRRCHSSAAPAAADHRRRVGALPSAGAHRRVGAGGAASDGCGTGGRLRAADVRHRRGAARVGIAGAAARGTAVAAVGSVSGHKPNAQVVVVRCVHPVPDLVVVGSGAVAFPVLSRDARVPPLRRAAFSVVAARTRLPTVTSCPQDGMVDAPGLARHLTAADGSSTGNRRDRAATERRTLHPTGLGRVVAAVSCVRGCARSPLRARKACQSPDEANSCNAALTRIVENHFWTRCGRRAIPGNARPPSTRCVPASAARPSADDGCGTLPCGPCWRSASLTPE
eukprot:ctg_2044.g422